MAMTIKIAEFEGPFDLLLKLIEGEEMDIYNIQIHQITRDYIATINAMQLFDMNLAGEFLVMASILLEIKSKMLLPDHQYEAIAFEDSEDPRYELITKLVEYKRFKAVSQEVARRQISEDLVFTDRGQVFLDPALFRKDYETMSYDIDVLTRAFNRIIQNLKRFDADKLDFFKNIRRERFTTENKVRMIRDLFKEHHRVVFQSLFEGTLILEEFITVFLAVLEVVRTDGIRVVQDRPFAEIHLIKEG
jgi:segregation and condensation protein A